MKIRQALDKKLGQVISVTTTYNLLHRHGWRSLSPDKRHPKADVHAQEDWKKTTRYFAGNRRKLARQRERGITSHVSR